MSTKHALGTNSVFLCLLYRKFKFVRRLLHEHHIVVSRNFPWQLTLKDTQFLLIF
jgi:hypothetical protein